MEVARFYSLEKCGTRGVSETWVKWQMRMLASIKMCVPEGRVTGSLGEGGEFVTFSKFLHHCWIKTLQQSLGFLDSTVTHDFE